MNKKQILLGMLVCLLALSFGLVGCSSDGGGAASVSGTTWVYSMTIKEAMQMDEDMADLTNAELQLMLDMMNLMQGTNYTLNTSIAIMKFEFKANGTVEIFENEGKDTEDWESLGTGTWSQEGSVVSVSEGGGDVETITISGNTFTIEIDDGEFATFRKR